VAEKENRSAWEMVEKYLRLKVGEQQITTPYFTNEVGRIFGRILKSGGIANEEIRRLFVPYNNMEHGYGWYRGKGSPEELSAAVVKMAEKDGIDMSTFTRDGARDYMVLNGLGVDCSGFAYNVLVRTLGAKEVNGVLSWKGEEQNAYKAGAFTFAAGASEEVDFGEIRPLDLLLFRKPDSGRYYHIALVLSRDGWKVVQSTSTAHPTGVDVSGIVINEGKPRFEFVPTYGKDWNQLYAEGRIELRRLKTVK